MEVLPLPQSATPSVFAPISLTSLSLRTSLHHEASLHSACFSTLSLCDSQQFHRSDGVLGILALELLALAWWSSFSASQEYPGLLGYTSTHLISDARFWTISLTDTPIFRLSGRFLLWSWHFHCILPMLFPKPASTCDKSFHFFSCQQPRIPLSLKAWVVQLELSIPLTLCQILLLLSSKWIANQFHHLLALRVQVPSSLPSWWQLAGCVSMQ